MYEIVLALTILLACVVTGLALAHALERPGRLRLDRDTYLIVQSLYSPGFRIGGFAEPLLIVATFALVIMTPSGGTMFFPHLLGFIAFVLVHVVFWVIVRPANKFWELERKLHDSGDEWIAMRDQWDMGHIARAVLGGLGLAALVFGSVTRLFM